MKKRIVTKSLIKKSGSARPQQNQPPCNRAAPTKPSRPGFRQKTPQVRQAKRSAASTREGQRPHHSSLTVITALDHSTDFLEIYTYFDQRLPNDT